LGHLAPTPRLIITAVSVMGENCDACIMREARTAKSLMTPITSDLAGVESSPVLSSRTVKATSKGTDVALEHGINRIVTESNVLSQKEACYRGSCLMEARLCC